MTGYHPPLRDIRFVLTHVTPLEKLTALEDFDHVEEDVVDGLLAEAGRFCAEVIAPTNRDGDLEGSVITDGEVVTPESFKAAYDAYVAAGWGAVQHPVEHGGGGFPLLVANAVKEMITSANMAFSLCPLLTTGAVVGLVAHGSEEQQETFLPKMVSGEWAGAMNLTEPQAGSDVGAITTRAEPVVERGSERSDDGTYRITGQKIFITYGDHDLTDNIIHLVLARLPDAPPGTRGVSLFIVPKYLLDDDGEPGARNDVEVVSLEHKLGIHASPTCVMAFGENSEGAVGYLVGEAHHGMRQMFTMMNDARLGVGLEGLAISERAYQQALDYAQGREQGRAPGTPRGERSAIIEHADVRRMLLEMKATIEAMRCLAYRNAMAIDLAHHHHDEAVRAREQMVADLLTPLSKAWCTDLGVDNTSLNVQVHGGMGYVEETGAAQHFRDARIAPIYEGTNGIQAVDLVGRKLGYDDGAFVPSFIADMRDVLEELEGAELAPIAEELAPAIDTLEDTTRWLLANRGEINDLLAGATPYLRLFATTVGGWLLARSAVAAEAELEAGRGEGDEPFLEAKTVTARFYAEQILPRVSGLASAATAGAEDLFALTPDQLGG